MDGQVQTGMPLTSSQLAQAGTIKVGDYVNYTPSSGSVTVTVAQTGAEDPQTFSTANDSGMTWRVLSVNSTTGVIKIVASPTSNTLELRGRAGFGNAETVLNSVAGIYGGGIGAASVRSITEDDIFDAIGYNKVADYDEELYTFTSGEWFTQTWDSTLGMATAYSTTTTTATSESLVTLHNTIANPPIRTASELVENVTDEEQIVYDMLFMNGDVLYNYWCASRITYCDYSGVSFGLRTVCDGFIDGSLYDGGGSISMFYSSPANYMNNYEGYTLENRYSHAVVPIVTLQSNIGMEQDTNNIWNFVQ